MVLKYQRKKEFYMEQAKLSYTDKEIEDSINRFNVSELSDMVTLIERIEQSSENTKAILLKVLAK